MHDSESNLTTRPLCLDTGFVADSKVVGDDEIAGLVLYHQHIGTQTQYGSNSKIVQILAMIAK